MSSESAADHDCGSLLFLSLPDDVLALISSHLRPLDLLDLALCCRSIFAALTASEKAWLAQCRRLRHLPQHLHLWREGVRSYLALCHFLVAVKPLLGLWVYKNPEHGNVVCVLWGFLSVVGVRIIPQELGSSQIHAGPLLWTPVFEIIADDDGSPSCFFLHGSGDGGEGTLFPGSVQSIGTSCNALLIEVNFRPKTTTISDRTGPPLVGEEARGGSAKSPLPFSFVPFSQIPITDRLWLLKHFACRVVDVPADRASGHCIPCNNAELFPRRRSELLKMHRQLNGGRIDPNSCEGAAREKHANLGDLLNSSGGIGLSLRAALLKLNSPRAWPSMYDWFALHKLSLPALLTDHEHAGLWMGSFGWPPLRLSEDDPIKPSLFLWLSYEEVQGSSSLIASKILERAYYYIRYPNGSAMFVANLDEVSADAFPWEMDGDNRRVEVVESYNGEGIASGYGFRHPSTTPGSLFVLKNGLLAFVWRESNSVLALQRIDLEELLNRGRRVQMLPPIAYFSFLSRSYDSVFAGIQYSSDDSDS